MIPTGIELSVAGLQEVGEIERAIVEFASSSNGGLIVTASPVGANHPDLIAELAARHKLPTVYPFRYFVESGGLISYGPDFVGQLGAAAGYVDRILKGNSANAARARRRGHRVKRRDFITLLGGTTAAWPLVARAPKLV